MIALRLTALCLCSLLSLGAAAQTLPKLPSLPTLPSLSTQALHPIIALLPKGQVNKLYPATNLISGGTPPYSGQVQGSVPQGMSIGSTGTLFGTPRQMGSFKFKVDFTDSAGATLEMSYTLQINR